MKANKRVISTNYAPEEIFSILVEQHRLCSPLDPIADETFVLTPETTIDYWRDAQDLKDLKGLAKFLNQQFRVAISLEEWRSSFEPEDKKTISDICQLIALYAIKTQTEAKRILGANCLTASVFLDLKERLNSKGVNVTELRPSSKIASYLEKYFSPMIEELTQTGVRIFDKIEARRSRVVNTELLTGDVVTFRDVVNRICEGNKLSS